MRRRERVWYKAANKKEKIYQYLTFILGTTFALFVLYNMYFVHPEMTNPEFVKWMYVRDNNWIYLVLFIIAMLFLYIKGNQTAFKQMMNRDNPKN